MTGNFKDYDFYDINQNHSYGLYAFASYKGGPRGLYSMNNVPAFNVYEKLELDIEERVAKKNLKILDKVSYQNYQFDKTHKDDDGNL